MGTTIRKQGHHSSVGAPAGDRPPNADSEGYADCLQTPDSPRGPSPGLGIVGILLGIRFRFAALCWPAWGCPSGLPRAVKSILPEALTLSHGCVLCLAAWRRTGSAQPQRQGVREQLHLDSALSPSNPSRCQMASGLETTHIKKWAKSIRIHLAARQFCFFLHSSSFPYRISQTRMKAAPNRSPQEQSKPRSHHNPRLGSLRKPVLRREGLGATWCRVLGMLLLIYVFVLQIAVAQHRATRVGQRNPLPLLPKEAALIYQKHGCHDQEYDC